MTQATRTQMRKKTNKMRQSIVDRTLGRCQGSGLKLAWSVSKLKISNLKLAAPAKINLFLKILGRRDDGYHLLSTLMQKVALYDYLEMELVSGQIILECSDNTLPVDDSNIVVRAARLFFSEFRERLPSRAGIRILLQKNIPVAAGLGGGSSDAAAVLTGLDRLYQTSCSVRELAELGLCLGADVPFFVYSHSAAWAVGIGEVLTPVPGLAPSLILLVNPGFAVSTKWVYEKFSLTNGEDVYNLIYSSSLDDIKKMEYFCRKHHFRSDEVSNDLESVTLRAFKELADIKEYLLASGAVSTLMSGSGPTVFGIFLEKDRLRAEQCLLKMKELYEQVFLVFPLDGRQDIEKS